MSSPAEHSEPFPADEPETAGQIRQQLSRILGSRLFRRSEGQKALLRFVVEETLAGRGERLKARSIAVKALRRAKDFDAQTDPIVSIQAGRLRRALSRYYEDEGRGDPLVISIPVGRYVPTFTPRTRAEAPSPEDSRATPIRSPHDVGGPRVAVCQFVDLSAELDQGYFAAGITQEIVTELTRFQELCVLACQKAPCALGVSQDETACDCELGARFVLRGTTRRADESARIAVQLVDTDSGRQIWAESFRRQLSTAGLFEIQDEIAQSVVGTVADNYGVISRTLCKEVRTQQPREFCSYEAVLRFRHYQFEVSNQSREVAIEALEQAVQRDPEYALAWAMLSEATGDTFGLRIDTNAEVIAKSREQAQHALGLDPDCQHAHWAMAMSHFHARERIRFIREAEETIALNPNNGYLVGVAAWAIALVGEWERGLTVLGRIMGSNPHYPSWFLLAPYLECYRHGDYEGALLHAEKFNTKLAWDPIVRAAALGQLDRRKDARDAVAELQTQFPNAAADPAHYVRGYIFGEELVEDVVDGLRKAGWNHAT